MTNKVARKDDKERREPPDIFRAAREDDLYELQLALQDGQTLRGGNLQTGLTPVHVAAMRGSVNFIRAAMEHDPETAWIQDNQLRMPFNHAAVRRDRQSMAHLHNAMYPEAAIPIPDKQ